MKKLNNKGFAISTLIYGILILFILIMSVLISTLNFRYRSLSDIASKAENQKSEYFLNIGINLHNNDTYNTPYSGTYTFSYIGKDEANQNVEKECSVYLEKDNIVNYDENKLIVGGTEITNCDFEDSLTINIKSVKNTEKLTEDISGANAPDISNGLVPVKYDEDKRKWVITTASDPEWYDYSEQKWANAVSLDSTKTSLFADGKPIVGTELTLPTSSSTNSDVLAMFVWIPRYSYTIGCTNINDNISGTGINKSFSVKNEPTECLGYKISGALNISFTIGELDNMKIKPGAIDIKFITISERDEITGNKPDYTYDDNSREAKNWYTPPAFWWDKNEDGKRDLSEELSGIWVGKFETSNDVTSNCYKNPSETNCNKSTEVPKILPNVKPLRYQDVYNQFYTAKKFGEEGNIYGIKGDSHLIKNSEWALVAYLSQSIYGKYGNSNYTNANKEIYINNYTTAEKNGTNYYTGRSAGSPGGSSTAAYSTSSYYYDDITDRGSGKGQAGGGASTTGNVYGIYDMVGGTHERVMANYNNNHASGGFPTGWFDIIENKKYYDKYTTEYIFSTIDKNTNSPGHANGETRRWYEDATANPSESEPWFYRGDRAGRANLSNTGIFYNSPCGGYATQYSSFRTVLIIE